MLKAEKATVNWDAKRKLWHVRVQIGEEVIKRPLANTPRDATEEALRAKAFATASDEGYEVDPTQIAIQR
jgi:hypothetical protein